MVNWRARLKIAVETAKPKPHDSLVDEVAMLTATAFHHPSVRLIRLQRYRPRWNPEGLVRTVVVLELTDGLLTSVD